jgi:hypothetical protein
MSSDCDMTDMPRCILFKLFIGGELKWQTN